MKKTCFLFVYGRLEKGEDLEPKTIKSETPDSISGELYDLIDFPAGINIGSDTGDYILGETLEIEEDELPGLDNVEGGEDYKRIKVTTNLGYDAWAYEYIKRIPSDAKLIRRWEDTEDSKRFKKK